MNPVETFYDETAENEWERLGNHRLEYAITVKALEEFLPAAPARVADVGGAAGRYAIELARRGYCVSLADLSARCLEVARGKAAEAGVALDGILQADARDLRALPDGAFDAVLMMGPIYHLVEPCDRLQALREARRILKPGGLLFAAFLMRLNPITAAAVRCPEKLPDLWYLEEMILETGQYRKPEEGGGFTDAWFCRLNEIPPLMEEGGFRTLEAVSCEATLNEREGPLREVPDELWERWVDILYPIAKDPTIHGDAGHLLVVAKREG